METYGKCLARQTYVVLILIIMEDTHGENEHRAQRYKLLGPNPYYNGRYSWSNKKQELVKAFNAVLILIIMEDTHGGSH